MQPTFSQQPRGPQQSFHPADGGLSLKLSKYHFCKSFLQYLGYIITWDRLSTDENIQSNRSSSALSWLATTIGWSKAMQRLQNTSLHSQGSCPHSCGLVNANFPWMTSSQSCVHRQFWFHTDTCSVGLGAALVQTDVNGQERAVAYPSRTTSKSKRLYSTSVKECLVVIWALVHLRPYTEETHVTEVTDHSSLWWLMSQPTLSGWLAQ